MFLFLRNLLPLLFLLLSPNFIYAHGSVGGYASGPDRSISFPDTKEYLTISSDLHTHSVFSDGHVWPNIRVSEAEKDTIDVLAITEHLEYQPHTNFIPNEDRNAAYLEAKKASEGTDLIVIAGSEITREMPPGHMNAIFIRDANKLFYINKDQLPEVKEIIDERAKDMNLREEEMVVIEKFALSNLWPAVEALIETKKQGAFVFWNHPMWDSQAPDGVARLSDMHKDFISQDLMHGIEIVNTDTYSEEAFQIALDNNLALIGTSDVHNLIEWDYDAYKNEHRPVTLIFAKRRTEESIREALFDRRTVVVYKDKLIGRSDDLMPLLESILSANSDGYRKGTRILKVGISNNSSSSMVLKNLSEVNFVDSDDFIVVPKNGSVKLNIKTLDKLKNLNLQFEVLNALTAPKQNPVIELEIKI